MSGLMSDHGRKWRSRPMDFLVRTAEKLIENKAAICIALNIESCIEI